MVREEGPVATRDVTAEPGGQPDAWKKRHGREWRRHRDRHGMTWLERKARSERYCVGTSGASGAGPETWRWAPRAA